MKLSMVNWRHLTYSTVELKPDSWFGTKVRVYRCSRCGKRWENHPPNAGERCKGK